MNHNQNHLPENQLMTSANYNGPLSTQYHSICYTLICDQVTQSPFVNRASMWFSLLSAFMQTSQPTNYNNNSFPFKYFAFTSVIRNTSWSKVFIVFMNFCKWKVFFNTKIQKLKLWGMFKIIIFLNSGLNFF